jgi:hypothetical protein
VTHRILEEYNRRNPLEWFAACDGLEFVLPIYEQDICHLATGVYGNGDGAIAIMSADGQMFDKLTVCLGRAICPEDFYVKYPELEDEYSWQHALLGAGIFRQIPGTDVAQGFVTRYARLWTFTQCETCKVPAVLCEEHRAKWAKNVEDWRERMLARDTVRRLRDDENTRLP